MRVFCGRCLEGYGRIVQMRTDLRRELLICPKCHLGVAIAWVANIVGRDYDRP